MGIVVVFEAELYGQLFRFKDIPDLLAKANEPKSGDTLAGIAAASASERVAAKIALAGVTLETLRTTPLVPANDAVSRIIDDAVNEHHYDRIREWTVAQLREYILAASTTTRDLDRLRRALTAEMIAAVTKLMSNLDLVAAARKLTVVAHANNTIGLPNRLAVRLQPNHPTDDVDGILASLRDGLSYGCGDAVIGINPVTDDAASTHAILDATHQFIEDWSIPTQNCVLAHVTTQLDALDDGAPVGLCFQSIAGTEKANTTFGIDTAILDDAQQRVRKHGTVHGPNVMYFETGQGSELSAGAHHGIDQLTLEARCYGLAKRYEPFIVNTVVGFIGPEYLYDARQITRAGLEDHFMGKLTGIPMGCDACYTNHADADQNDLENLAILLAAAGVTYFMGLPMGDDVMLNYQSTSFHDNATLREVLGLRPAPEFEAWLEAHGLMADGRLTDRAGDASYFNMPKRS